MMVNIVVSIIKALDQRPDLAYESIAVVFFIDIGLERCQQTFSDLNRYAIVQVVL